MKKTQTSERQHQSVQTPKTSGARQDPEPETPGSSWPLYAVLTIIALGVLMIVAKVLGLF